MKRAPTSRLAGGIRHTRRPDFARAIAGRRISALPPPPRASGPRRPPAYRGRSRQPSKSHCDDKHRDPEMPAAPTSRRAARPSPPTRTAPASSRDSGNLGLTSPPACVPPGRSAPLVRPVPAGATGELVRYRPARATSGGRDGARSRPGQAARAGSGRRVRSAARATIARISSRENQRASASSSGSTVISSVSASHRKPIIRLDGNGQGCARQVAHAPDPDARFLEGLAAHRLLQRLAGLHEPGKAREAVAGAPAVAAEQRNARPVPPA